MGRAVARRRSGYSHDVEIEGAGPGPAAGASLDAASHSLVVDEPEASGGADEGPSPTQLLGAALGACTAITVEMYAQRKDWDVSRLEVVVETSYEGPVPTAFDVTLHCPGDLDPEQLRRLVVIAAKCPVHKALSGETDVRVSDHVVTAAA